MALSNTQIAHLKEELDNCKNPLFFFDDDQDGLCAFLLLYRYKQDGHGVIVKTTPKIGTVFLRKVEEYKPDKIFVLDIADIEQDFLDAVKVPVVWVDHHGPFEREKVLYFNPRTSNQNDNFSTSHLCYQVVQRDIWISTLGCIADWFLPPFLENFKKEYPDLIDDQYNNAGDILYNTKLGHLIRIFSFILKGKISEVMKCVKILTRIKSPYEILNSDTEQGKFIYNKYEQANKMYVPLLKDAIESVEKSRDELVIYIYKDDQTSFTSDLSNEIIFKYPSKIILIAREKNEEMKCSLRSSKIILPPLIEKALIGLEGYGGGHEHACGLNIRTRDFDEFVRRFREMI